MVTFRVAGDDGVWAEVAARINDGGGWRGLRGAAPAQGVDPATLTTYRQITNKANHWRVTSTIATVGGSTSFTAHDVRHPAKALRMRWGVHGWAGVTEMVYRTAFLIRGTIYPVTWAGQDTVTVAALASVESDPLPDDVLVSPGEVIHTLLYIGQDGAAPQTANMADARNSVQAGDVTRGGEVPGGSNAQTRAPVSITGLAPAGTVSFGCHGDSILESGWMRGAAEANGLAWADMGQWAEGIPVHMESQGGWIANRIPQSGPLPYTHALTEYAINNHTETVAAVQTKLIAWWNYLASRGVKLGQTTVTPRSTSTDGWTTTEGQTAWELDATWRVPLNEWLRDGAPLVNGAAAATGTTDATAVRMGETGHPLFAPVCDIADEVETYRNSGIRKIPAEGPPVTDGTHPTKVGADQIQPAAEAWVSEYVA